MIAGTNYGLVENIKTSGEVKGTDYVGGLIGILEVGGEIKYCINSENVNGVYCVGGISGTGGIVTNCGNNGNIKAEKGAVGGIIGGGNNTPVVGCYNKGEVYGYSGPSNDPRYTSAGGIMGTSGPVRYSYNRGKVYGAYGQVGGISRELL